MDIKITEIDETNDSKLNENYSGIVESTVMPDTTNGSMVVDTLHNQTNDTFISCENDNYLTSSKEDVNKNKPWRKYIRRRVVDE